MNVPAKMQAAVLHNHGELDALTVHTDWPTPHPTSGEVLVRIAAAGINNTDINTRIGWYSKTVTGATEGAAIDASDDAGGWNGAIAFPRIQGADVCGHIVAVGDGVSGRRIGERILIRALIPSDDSAEGLQVATFGSERDGGFAEFTTCAAVDAVAIDSSLADTDLASFPCAASTALGLLRRLKIATGERVLITGASGGVGSFAVQIAKHLGCHVTALTSATKRDFVRSLGADNVLDRTADLPENIFDAVADLVGGSAFTSLLDALKRGGRYGTSGAIAGPIVDLDLRTLYLKDLKLVGSTYQPPGLFEDLVAMIESNALRPHVSFTYPLSRIAEAQTDFMSKTYPGKLVLVPDTHYEEGKCP